MKLLDLPIDHFRLLGVSPSADAAAILHRLQTRCDSPPDQGFTHEALLKRNELLSRSADLLTDRDDRAEYESALLRLSASHPNETVGLDLPASSEVAGLIPSLGGPWSPRGVPDGESWASATPSTCARQWAGS